MKDKQAETSQENVFFSRLEKERIKLSALEDYKQKHEKEDFSRRWNGLYRLGSRTDVPEATKSGRSMSDRN